MLHVETARMFSFIEGLKLCWFSAGEGKAIPAMKTYRRIAA
jgi:hypothetical protein